MSNKIFKMVTAGVLGAGVFTAVPALAHHSYAMFDRTKEATVTGTVRTFQWTNPHVYLWMYAPDSAGKESVWGFEFVGGPNGLSRTGWTKRTLNEGDKVTVKYNPLRDGRTGGMFVNVKLPNGKTMDPRGEVPAGGRQGGGEGGG